MQLSFIHLGFSSSTSSVTPGTNYRDVGSGTKWATPAPSSQVGAKYNEVQLHRVQTATLNLGSSAGNGVLPQDQGEVKLDTKWTLAGSVTGWSAVSSVTSRDLFVF